MYRYEQVIRRVCHDSDLLARISDLGWSQRDGGRKKYVPNVFRNARNWRARDFHLTKRNLSASPHLYERNQLPLGSISLFINILPSLCKFGELAKQLLSARLDLNLRLSIVHTYNLNILSQAFQLQVKQLCK